MKGKGKGNNIYEYRKFKRTSGETAVIVYDLKLTCDKEMVNKLTNRVITNILPYEPVLWRSNDDGTASTDMYNVGEYSFKKFQKEWDYYVLGVI